MTRLELKVYSVRKRVRRETVRVVPLENNSSGGGGESASSTSSCVHNKFMRHTQASTAAAAAAVVVVGVCAKVWFSTWIYKW